LQAAVLRVKLRWLDSWSDRRRENAQRYDTMFREISPEFEVVIPFVRSDVRHIFHQYVVRVPKHRDALIKYLTQQGVGTGIYYPIPLHLQTCFRYLGYNEGDFPVTERVAQEAMALPIFPEISESQQRHVVSAFANWHP
jgi:dTDP-4-amino-4,6-dideoxygalactose transaminase